MLKTAIIIPAYNEERYIKTCLENYISQTVKPDLVLVVDDNSEDNTQQIVDSIGELHPWIRCVRYSSEAKHRPGAKVINAFSYGMSLLGDEFELIGKFDADILLPENYFDVVFQAFDQDPELGLCSGLLYIKQDDKWLYESIANRTHVRGPVKLYRKNCIRAMGGLRPGLGWDTADTFLVELHGYKMKTLPELKVKHLRPTGSSYHSSMAVKQGMAYRNMRYGLMIAFLAALKSAWTRRSLKVIWQSLRGYFGAAKDKLPYLVTSAEGRFIRKRRWKMIGQKLF
jgi:glycosyltransferase involved in cell wall biosynthesis